MQIRMTLMGSDPGRDSSLCLKLIQRTYRYKEIWTYVAIIKLELVNLLNLIREKSIETVHIAYIMEQQECRPRIELVQD